MQERGRNNQAGDLPLQPGPWSVANELNERLPLWSQIREDCPSDPVGADPIAGNAPLPHSSLLFPGIALVEVVAERCLLGGPRIQAQSPTDVARVFKAAIGRSDRERFAVLLVNTRREITHLHIVSTGTLNSSLVHPRETFKAAVLANAAAIIVGHNHPTGDVTPSSDDLATHRRLEKAGRLMGIPLLDALIVGPGNRFHSAMAGSELSYE